MESDTARTSDANAAGTSFACEVLDADDIILVVKRREGTIVYVRIQTGELPSSMNNILVGAYHTLYARPAQGAFTPTAALLTVPAGRIYPVVLLATLPPVAVLRPHLRAGLRPPPGLAQDAVPVALEGLPSGFRATAGSLTQQGAPGDAHGSRWPDTRALEAEELRRVRRQRLLANSDNWNDRAALTEVVLADLSHELKLVRSLAAWHSRLIAGRLPVAPFLEAIRDTRPINEAMCQAAAYVFAAHPDEVPVEAVLTLYRGVDRSPGPIVQALALRALGKLGTRAPVDVLAEPLREQRAIYDIRVREAAARALGELGEHAPVDALIAGMEYPLPEVAAAAAARPGGASRRAARCAACAGARTKRRKHCAPHLLRSIP